MVLALDMPSKGTKEPKKVIFILIMSPTMM